MTTREVIGTALAQAEAAREYLEARYAEAKAALVTTVTDASKIDTNRADAEAKVEKARARCRELRAVLADPRQLEFITRSRERLVTPAGQPGYLPKGESSAKPVSVPPRQQAPSSKNAEAAVEPSPRKRSKRFGKAYVAPPRIREAIGLLALTLAYLHYYYLDVQLQILELPSVMVFVLHR